MPINADPNQKKQDQTQEGQPQPTTSVAGPVSAASSASRVADYSTGAQGGSGSGRFTNLQKYIGANSGSGQYLANKITGDIEKQSNEYGNNDQLNQIKQNVTGANSNLDKSAGYQTALNSGDARPINNDTNEKGNFQNILNNKGQSGALQTNATNLATQKTSQYDTLTNNIQNLGNEQGRYNLLQNSIKAPSYSTGQQRLDQLFLASGAQPGFLGHKQQELGSQAQVANNNLGLSMNGLTANLAGLKTREGQEAINLKGALGNAENTFTKQQTDEANALNTSRKGHSTILNQFLGSGFNTLNDDEKTYINSQIAKGGLNLNSNTYKLLDNQGYQKYIEAGKKVNAADLVNDADLSRYQALAGLAGYDPSRMAYNAVGDTGVDAGLKSQQLATEIESARQNLVNNFTNKQIKGSSGNGVVNASGNAKELLDWYEGTMNPGTQSFAYSSGGYSPANDLLPIINDHGGKGYRLGDADLRSRPDLAARGFGDIRNIGAYGGSTGSGYGFDAPTGFGQATGDVLKQLYGQLTDAGYFGTLGGDGFEVNNRDTKVNKF